MKRSILYKTLIFIVPIAIIVYLLPRTDEHRYIYEVNRPWAYSLLTAPFDIPVNLDSLSAERVRDSVINHLEPVFQRNLETENTNISLVAERLKATSGLNISYSDQNRIIGAIREVYDNGIVNQPTYDAIRDGELPMVRFVNDNVAVSAPTDRFRSQRQAYAAIDSALNEPRFREAMSEISLNDLITPNILYDSVETARVTIEVLRKELAPRGVVQQGERIIDEGEVVTPQLFTLLQTYEKMLSEKDSGREAELYYPILGQILYLVIIFASLYAFLFFFRPQYWKSTRVLLFIMMIITVFAIFIFAMVGTFSNGMYIVPCTIVPIMTLIFLDSRTALFTHIVTTLIGSMACVGQFEFIFMQFIAGTAAIQSVQELSRRSQLIRAAVAVLVAYSLSYVSIKLIQLGSIHAISLHVIGCFVMNAVMVSFTYVLILIIEKLFGFTSKVTLVELSDINNPVLRELSEECPGTFQHSMAVSNLASAAARRIGANVQLVRTGALYHDIGKIDNPAFFTENQHGINPHDHLDPVQSARIVLGHVTDGLRRAEKAKLPQMVTDFITQHHGRGTARYFYTTYCNAHPDETPDPSLFTYPGPNPQTKESSILMMADAVEASSRSLTDHSPEAIAKLVDRIIDTQIAEGLHNDSPLSFRDVKAIKDTFASRLRTMFHTRISYPESTTGAGAAAAPADDTPTVVESAPADDNKTAS